MKGNPFMEAAAEGIGEAALREMEWRRQQAAWAAHVEGCRAIMRHGILGRMELAAEAANHWGHDATVTGVFETSTSNGVLHLRVKLVLDFGAKRFSQLEFIGSPKSVVIATEAHRMSERRRWHKVKLTADDISGHADTVIREFLKWAVV